MDKLKSLQRVRTLATVLVLRLHCHVKISSTKSPNTIVVDTKWVDSPGSGLIDTVANPQLSDSLVIRASSLRL